MYGIKKMELEWFSSCLSNGKQAVLCHTFQVRVSSRLVYLEGQSWDNSYSCFFFINDISNFTTNGCVTNLFAVDAMVYASGDSVGEVKVKLQIV